MRRLALLTAVIVALPAASAPAATVALDGPTLRFAAGAGESNHPIFHYRSEDELVVYDSGGRVSAGPGCAQDGEATAICPRAGIARAAFTLGGSPRRAPSPDSLTLTASVPMPVDVSASSTARARVLYIDLRPVEVFLDGLANDGPAGRGDNIGPGIDNVFGGDGADVIAGSARANVLDGDNGSDDIAAGDGDDTVTLASFNDVGADAVGLESRGADGARCGDGLDTVYYDRSDTVTSDCELRVLVGDQGYSYRGTARADRIIAERGPAVVRGHGGDDRLGAMQHVGGVSLFGDAGDDRLAGHGSVDTLSGGPGNDSIHARDRVRDTVTCGTGRDTVVANRSDRVARDCERVVYR